MGQDINGRVRTHDAKTKLCHVSFNQHPASSPLSEAPRRDVCKQVRVNMDTNVLVRSGDILDLYRDFDRVLQALINDGWIVLKDATDTNSIERVASNQVRISALSLSLTWLKEPSTSTTSSLE